MCVTSFLPREEVLESLIYLTGKFIRNIYFMFYQTATNAHKFSTRSLCAPRIEWKTELTDSR